MIFFIIKYNFNNASTVFTVGALFFTSLLSHYVIIISNMMQNGLGQGAASIYFMLESGLSGVSAISIIFLLLTVGGYIASWVLKSKLSTMILKDEYQMQ